MTNPTIETENYTLYHGDCLEVMAHLSGVDAVITDPPYGIGLADWDSGVDVCGFLEKAKSVSGDFIAFFGQMPTIADWHRAAQLNDLHFCEHVSWVKRAQTPTCRLSRAHESIFIYSSRNRKKFYQSSGLFEDVKFPGILFDSYTIGSLQRYVADLHAKIEGKGSFRKSGIKSQSEFTRFRDNSVRPNSSRSTNFTNVWSFLSPSQKKRDGRFSHPCEKPTEIMKRLCEMLTPEGGRVLDPFMGSGTTGVACIESGRKFIGIERDETYFNVAVSRLEAATGKFSPRSFGELFAEQEFEATAF